MSDEDVYKTQATAVTKIAPVERFEDLPTEVASGTICFVRAEGESFIFVDGAWKGRKPRGTEEPK